MPRPLADDDPKKWEYSVHCYVKHKLFEKYFQKWSIILGRTFSKIGYFDGFAGRGVYEGGEEGSPLLALKVLESNKKYYDSCLCVFVEKVNENYKVLSDLLDEKKKKISSKIDIRHYNKEYEYFGFGSPMAGNIVCRNYRLNCIDKAHRAYLSRLCFRLL